MRQPIGQPHPRPHPRQHHDLLADRHRRFGSTVVREAYGPDAPAAGQTPLPASSLPFAFTTFPGEIWRTPRSWVEMSYPNVVYFHEVDKGGHFAAWEEPELFSQEMRPAFKSLR
jgi:pimeloyl-ACP methyl ester carboxylesterase